MKTLVLTPKRDHFNESYKENITPEVNISLKSDRSDLYSVYPPSEDSGLSSDLNILSIFSKDPSVIESAKKTLRCNKSSESRSSLDDSESGASCNGENLSSPEVGSLLKCFANILNSTNKIFENEGEKIVAESKDSSLEPNKVPQNLFPSTEENENPNISSILESSILQNKSTFKEENVDTRVELDDSNFIVNDYKNVTDFFESFDSSSTLNENKRSYLSLTEDALDSPKLNENNKILPSESNPQFEVGNLSEIKKENCISHNFFNENLNNNHNNEMGLHINKEQWYLLVNSINDINNKIDKIDSVMMVQNNPKKSNPLPLNYAGVFSNVLHLINYPNRFLNQLNKYPPYCMGSVIYFFHILHLFLLFLVIINFLQTVPLAYYQNLIISLYEFNYSNYLVNTISFVSLSIKNYFHWVFENSIFKYSDYAGTLLSNYRPQDFQGVVNSFVQSLQNRVV